MNEEQLVVNDLAIEVANKTASLAKSRAQLEMANRKIKELEQQIEELTAPTKD